MRKYPDKQKNKLKENHFVVKKLEKLKFVFIRFCTYILIRYVNFC